MKDKKTMSAFTLAEVLVTIVIISLLALITLPILKGGVDTKVTDGQKKSFIGKLQENLHAMQIAGDLAEAYDTTEDFINAMKKHMNISRTCSANKLSECFAEKVITEEKEVKYNTKQMSTSEDISAGFQGSDLGGVVFADGTSAIIAHNPDCYISDKYDSSIDTTACFAMLYDINGKNAPNIMDVDVFELNVNSFGLSFSIIDNRAYKVGSCDKNGVCYTPVGSDYWQGAVNFCNQKGGKLPSSAQIEEMMSVIYGSSFTSGRRTKNLESAIADENSYRINSLSINSNNKNSKQLYDLLSANNSDRFWGDTSVKRSYYSFREAYIMLFSANHVQYWPMSINSGDQSVICIK